MSDMSTTSTPSGMTGAGGGNMIRITGMASGLDVDAMVKKMMAGEQAKLDKAKQDQQTIQWKQDAYQSIIKDIKDLQSSFFDPTSSDSNILSSVNFTPFTVSGSNGSSVDTSVASMTPGVGAQTGTYSIKVNQLAAGAGVTNTLSGKVLSTSLASIVGDTSLNGPLNLVLNAGGSDINVTLDNTSGTSTIGDLVNAINNKTCGVIKASFSELTGEFNLASAATGASSTLTIKSGTTAALSSVLGFSAANNGSNTTADWTVSSTSTDVATATGTIQKGQDADVTITPPGGNPVTLNDANGNAKTTNNFTIDGMNYTLSSLGTATVSVSTNTQQVYDKIKGFIDKYNNIVDEIQTKLTEKKDYNYKPLTDAQKAAMSASEITAWETKAKVGILSNDDNLQNMLNNLREAFTTSVSNTALSIGSYGSNSFGIDTSTDYTKPGHIDIVDPSKLKAAIASNASQILKVFTNVSTSAPSTTYDSSSTQYLEDGIFTRIKSILQTNVGYTNTTLNTAILTSYANKQYDYSATGTGGKNTIPDKLYEQQLLVQKIIDSMNTKQDQYYQMFSKLETAMNSLNAQQAQLSSMIG